MTLRLHVLCATSNQHVIDSVQQTLTDANIPYHMEPLHQFDVIAPNALVMIDHESDLTTYFAQYEKRNVPFGIVDASSSQESPYKNFTMCKFVYCLGNGSLDLMVRDHLYPIPNPAEGLDWSRFNAVIVSRHSMHEGAHELYRMNIRILSYIPWPKVAISDPPAFDYMLHCVEGYKDKFDWVINIDDDAFLCDFKALYDMMVYMEENGYDICGMPDGLTYTPRDVFNPVSMNPFFNVIQLKTMKNKFTSPKEMVAAYHPSLLKYVDIAKFHPEMWGKTAEQITGDEFPVGYEPYYPFFYGITPKVKILWLYGRSYTFDHNAPRDLVIIPDEPRRGLTWHEGKKGITFEDDPWTTVLYNHENKEICLHTWYARYYGGSFDPTLPTIPNVPRINRIFRLACEKLCLI